MKGIFIRRLMARLARSLTFIFTSGLLATVPAVAAPPPSQLPLHRVLDMDVGESGEVQVGDGDSRVGFTVKVLDLQETREEIYSALTAARVKVVIDGVEAWVKCATYNLPVTVGRAQIECPVTRGVYLNNSDDFWKLRKQVRLRVWRAGSPWTAPGTF